MQLAQSSALFECCHRAPLGRVRHALDASLAAYVGHPAYNIDALCADLHRFAFLLGETDGEELFGEQTQ